MFDPSAPHIIILLVVVLLLFGSTRLPGAAEALGKSMRIFKHEAKKLNEDPPADAKVAPGAVQQTPVAPQLASQPVPPDATQQQLLDLQRQIQDLQRQSAGSSGSGAVANGAPLAEGQRGQQPL